MKSEKMILTMKTLSSQKAFHHLIPTLMFVPLSSHHTSANTVYMLPKPNVRNSSGLFFVQRRRGDVTGR
jgi:hypothetical protein